MKGAAMRNTLGVVVLSILAVVVAAAQQPPTPTPASTRDRAEYRPKQKDAVLKEMEERDDALRKAAADETAAIRAEQEEKADAKDETATDLRFDVTRIPAPTSPEAFSPSFHFPPVAQYLTGTCWSFSTTSFFESEIYRLHGRKVKLSEIWTVYWEYVRKMQGFVDSRGATPIAEGSESNAVEIAWREHGVVPLEAYPGVVAEDGRHDHAFLIEELQALGQWCLDNDIWDRELITRMTRAILDRHLGAPPETFAYEGRTFTPKQFFADVVALNLDDYVELMSTLSVPFYSYGSYDVPDNWWNSTDYLNVPLDEWYAALVRAVDAGYTVAIGGDVSEPGLYGPADLAVIPTFDIPQELIDQSSREFRFDNETSTDDHGIHLVGHMTTPDGHDWFLIKDSGRSSRRGRFEGYYFYRDDFVRLKMLTYVVHKDAVKYVLDKVR